MNEEEVFEDGQEDIVEEGEAIGLSANDTKLALAMRVIANLKDQIDNLERLLAGQAEPEEFEAMAARPRITEDDGDGFGGRVMDGVFDGENMVGEDGRKYNVPPNYASKSKLVEGDLLRLNISNSGKFIFKQKGPIERQRLMGSLMQDELSSDWKVIAGGHAYRVLPAAVSFHRGSTGDDAVILVPKNAPSRWAALENVVKRSDSDFNF
ncbi:MAG TPA: hypothetical protein VMU11_01025 [Verrucomicrobiae bacterium]|nr:hypothetical protein [Verrucomicrobiae bacterium]